MWLFLALASFLVFYKLFVSYYLGNVIRPSQLDRPLIFARGWFHCAVWSLGLLLLGLSALFAYLVNGWLVIVPLILAFILPGWNASKREAELDAAIKKSIVTHYELKEQGVPQSEIFKRVLAAVAGPTARDYVFLLESGNHDWDLERVIQYVILPAKGLWSYQPGQGLRGAERSAQIGQRIRGFMASFERVRVIHDETTAQK